MEDRENGSAQDERSTWTKPGFLIAGTFLLALLVLAGIVVVTGSDTGPSRDSARPGPTAGPTTAAPSPSSDQGDCPNLPDTPADEPQSAPTKGVEWTLLRTVALPSSKAAGPAVHEGDVARCYAHTPVGALFAAVQISGRYLFAADWRKVTKVQTVGAGKETYLRERAKIEASQGPMTPEADRHGQMAGFKFVTYSGSDAVVQLVHRFTNGSYVVTPVTVLWERGDWRLELPASRAKQTRVTDLSGFVAFGGV